MKLHLALKAEDFHAVRRHSRLHDIRLVNDHWTKRLCVAQDHYSGIVLTCGYPGELQGKDGDEPPIECDWKGATIGETFHPVLGRVEVYEIDVSSHREQGS